MKCVSCRWMRFRLPLLAGGDLLGAERRWADFHLRACPTCRELLASNGAAVDALHAASSEPAPPEPGTLWPALKLRISETRREPVLRLGAPWRRS